MNALIPFVCGALFSAGVCLSGMVRPSKVLGFLDVGGAWDASLMLVMASALALHVVAWRLVKSMRAPRFGTAFPGPASTVVDVRLVGGAAVFGVGWGLSGFCPGPALVSLVSGTTASFVFVGAMVAAMFAFSLCQRGSASFSVASQPRSAPPTGTRDPLGEIPEGFDRRARASMDG